MNVRFCFGEVGVDLELCVHAHGPDVELIMEASCINNGPLVISSSCIYVGPLQTWFRTWLIIFDPFLRQLEVLALCRSIRMPNLNFGLSSSITPGISRISCHRTISYELLMEHYLTLSLSLHGFWVVCQPITLISESIPHSDSTTLNNFCCLWV